NQSYLATEDSFRLVEDLESRNLIVPVVGNFAGPRAVRAVAAYLKHVNATVSAFYVSNVEQYLRQAGTWTEFCRNVATLPLDRASTFIRSARGGFRRAGGAGLQLELDPMMAQATACGGWW